MNKTSKTYAEKLAKEQLVKKYKREYVFTKGYMTAIKVNNVPELIEVLLIAPDIDEYETYEQFKEAYEIWYYQKRRPLIFDNALKKSKETNTETYGSK